MALRDRLRLGYFPGDEPVGVAAVAERDLPGPIDEREWRYVPERLWNRLLRVGHTYDLSFAQVLEPSIDTVLDRSQCESLAQEMAFVATVSDETLRDAIGLILDRTEEVLRGTRQRLVISPP